MQSRLVSSVKIIVFQGITRILIGMVLGIIFLHPVTMAIYWFEFNPDHSAFPTVWQFVTYRLARAFSSEMFPMTLIFAAVGGFLGSVFGAYYWAIARRDRLLIHFQQELARDVDSLIEMGESEIVEFKASARWDLQAGKVNKVLEYSIAKTIAGFLNNHGGNLLIGVTDSREVVGLRHDYRTLRRQDRDGFEQFIMSLIKHKLGGSVCTLVHVIFKTMDGKDVCRIIVESSNHPVYLRENGSSHYYLRTGNTSRELDVKEALQHIEHRLANN